MSAEKTQEEYFNYLSRLSKTGINMFRAAPYIKREFNLSDKKAEKVLVSWMESFEKT
jgi:uncharacterized protein YkwD